jgi:hypothetical protein
LFPDIVGIGAPKSGTTSFVRALDATGDFDVCRMKDSDILSGCDLLRAEAAYETEFSGDGRPKVDFSVLYFLSEMASANCQSFEKLPKIVFLARDPIDQIRSHYWHLRRQHFHSWETKDVTPTLADLLNNEPDRIVSASLYAKNLRMWPWEDPEHFFFLTFEELIDRPSKSLRRFARFCDVELSSNSERLFIQELGKKHRSGVKPRSRAHEAIYNRLYLFAISGPYHGLKHVLGVPVADRIKESLRLRQLAQRIFFNNNNIQDEDQDDIIPEWAVELLEEDKKELSLMFPGHLTYWTSARSTSRV